MSDIKWPAGIQTRQLKRDVTIHKDLILNGKMLSIDPATRTLGYATTEAGTVTEQGTIEIDPKLPINQRLQSIVRLMQAEKQTYDIVLVEMIRGRMAHAYLMFGVGAILGGVDCPIGIEVPICAWKAAAKVLEPDYIKSDANDAAMFARTVITMAKEL